METNKIYHGDCKEIMESFPDNCIDLTVTSPPYDNLRSYNGYDFDFEGIADQLFRITKPGGVVVWVVGDATVKGSETCTSFKQALYFKSIGFRLHDTMIWQKTNPIPQNHNRYEQCFEYMFVFSNGKPNTFKPLKIPTKNPGKIYNWDCKNDYGKSSAKRSRMESSKTKKTKNRFNIWEMNVASSRYTNSAPFPERLASDHIISWSNESNIVFDPMCGSGTTLKMAQENNRDFIGIDISEEYVKMSQDRCGITPLIK